MLQFLAMTQAGCRRSFPLHLLHRITTQAIATVVVLVAQGIHTQPVYADQASRPNIVLIMSDDQGYGDFSLHGNPHLSTPHIDALGQTGIRFERFYVNSFCAPTRAALLTGRYPLRCGVFGVTHNKETMRANETTIAEALKISGYRTACIGKWHNGEQYPYTPPGQGFDEFFGFHNGHINNYFDTELIRGSRPEATQGYISDVLTNEAIRFIERNKQSPFFCYLSFNAPHSPYQVPDKYYDKFRAKGFEESVAAFYGMCENIDDNVGRLLKELEQLQVAENTIVLFLTDNGGTAGVKIYNAGMRGGKTSVHEGGSRVPLFIRWPARFKQPKVVGQLTSHIDLYPTLLDLCGLQPPAGLPLDGVSLRPLLEGQTVEWPDRVLFTHNPISETNRYPGAVRTSQYRLVREIKGPQGGSSATQADATAPAWQLYDMQQDPGEKQNLAGQHPEIVRELSRLYETWIDDTRLPGLNRLPIPVGYAEENPVVLNAPQAFLHGKLRFDHGPGFAHDWITDWSETAASISFDLEVIQSGEYDIAIQYASTQPKGQCEWQLTGPADSRLSGQLPPQSAPVIPLPHRDRRSRERYVNRQWKTQPLGRINVSQGRGEWRFQLTELSEDQSLEFKALVFRRVEPEPRLP